MERIKVYPGAEITGEIMHRAFYFRPDGEDREGEQYMKEHPELTDEYQKLIDMIKPYLVETIIYYTPQLDLCWTMVLKGYNIFEFDDLKIPDDIYGDQNNTVVLESTPENQMICFFESY